MVFWLIDNFWPPFTPNYLKFPLGWHAQGKEAWGLIAAGAAGTNGVDVDSFCRTTLDDIYAIGYTSAAATAEVVRLAGNDLTRENVMKQAASMDLTLPMLLPGVNIKTGPDDFYPIEREQLMKFDGKTWQLFGKVYGR